MKTLFTLLISCFSFVVAAQVPEPIMLSLKGIGGNVDDNLISNVTKTQDGGFILHIETNSTYGTGNIDSFCGFGGGREIFLKYNTDASVLEWYKCYGGGGDSFLTYIFPTNDGGAVLGGEFNSDIGWGFLICKEDALGNILWQKSYSEGKNVLLRAMIATDDGGYIMCGQCSYIDTNFTIHYGSFVNPDIGIIKLDSNGNKVWSKVIGGSDIEDVFSVAAAPGDGCYIFGSTQSTDNDCSGNHGERDAYLARLDNNGNILWHNDLGGSGDDGYYGYGVADGKGGVVLTAGSNSTDGDVHHHIGNFDYWALEVDSSNNILWDNSYGSVYLEFPISICKATDGSIWIMGETFLQGGEVDTSYGNGDAWIVHADSAGNFLNAEVLGSSNGDEGTMIYPLSGGDIITGGIYAGNNGSFNSLTYYGSSLTFNTFLATFGPMDQTLVQQVSKDKNGINIFPNPANDKLNISLSEPTQSEMEISINDLMGRNLYYDRCPNNIDNLQIDVSQWPKGVYFVRVMRTNGYWITKKLLVV